MKMISQLLQYLGKEKMSYQSLFNVLEGQIDSECQEIIAAAQKRGDGIIRAAKQEVEKLNKQLLEESTKREEVKDREQAVTQNYKLSKLLTQVKLEVFQQLFDTVKNKLSELPSKPEYSCVLKKLIQEATSDFPECTKIKVNPRDTSLAEKILSELKLKLEVESTRDFSAGVVATSADGRMSICNNLELRLKKLIPIISPQVANILYG